MDLKWIAVLAIGVAGLLSPVPGSCIAAICMIFLIVA